jgi:nucleotide-binding universal stress UspA family protein
VNELARILVPLDGSAKAEAALAWVRRFPARRVRLLHVVPQDGASEARAASYMRQVAIRLDMPDLHVETRVVRGGPADVIVADAADRDLIVMCTQGHGAGGRRVFGSVADRVARHAPIPTLLVRGGSDPVPAEPVRRVVVPLDGSPAAERALPVAAGLALLLAKPVLLVTVVEAAQDQDSLEDHLHRAEESLRARGVPVVCELRQGSPAAELLSAIGTGDVIVATTHGQGAARRWQIGSVAERLLRYADAPLLLIRADIS